MGGSRQERFGSRSATLSQPMGRLAASLGWSACACVISVTLKCWQVASQCNAFSAILSSRTISCTVLLLAFCHAAHCPRANGNSILSFHGKGEVREGRQDLPFTREPLLHRALHLYSLSLWTFESSISSSLGWQWGVVMGRQIPPSPPCCPAPARRQPVGEPLGLGSW